MPRYIDADAFLLAEIERCGSQPVVGTCTMDNEYLSIRIAAAPTISPDEVRGVGEWEEVRDRGGYLTPGGTPIVRCSACDGAEHLSGVEFPETFRFCPSCGARMKGAEDGTADN